MKRVASEVSNEVCEETHQKSFKIWGGEKCDG
jgi:hypothetical protein